MIDDICVKYYREISEIKCVADNDDYAIIDESRVGKNYKVIYGDSQYTNFCKVEDSDKLKLFDQKGFKYRNYIELLINYSDDLFLDLNPIDKFEMKRFNIGNVVVEIDKPTLLFDIIMDFVCDKYYERDDYWTISLRGVTNDNYEDYLASALYLINYYNKCSHYEWEVEVESFCGYHDMCGYEDKNVIKEMLEKQQSSEFKSKVFKDFRFPTVLRYYNEGCKLLYNETSFHYFYKIIEYFFLINRKNDFIKYINIYNSNNDLEIFINSINKIYGTDEKEQLKMVIKSIETDAKPLINKGFGMKFLKSNDVVEFSNELYQYRNSIVHGKSDKKYQVKLPSIVSCEEDKFWNDIIKRIAEILIDKYCKQ